MVERVCVALDFVMTEKNFTTSTAFGDLHISSEGENGFRPFQLLLSSLAGCSGEMMRTILQKKRISFSSIEINTKMESNTRGRVTDIHLHFVVTGKQLDENAMEKVLKLTKRNCQMIQSVQAGINITESITLKEG